jgi:hypothetical protein
MIFSEQRLSKMWRSGLAVAGFAGLAILATGEFAVAQQAVVGPAKGASQQLSENVRKQILEKLLKGTHDPDVDVANHSFAGLAPVADAEMATQALVALLDRPVSTEEELLQKLHFAGCLLAHGIAREKVLASVLEAAATSDHAAVRFRAINVLVFAEAGNTSAGVVRMLIATAKDPKLGLREAPPKNRIRGLSNAGEWAVDRPAVKALIARAAGYKAGPEADRAERVVSALLVAMQSADEARAEAELIALVNGYNCLIKQDRWSEALHVAERAREIVPGNPVTTIMYEKARIGRQVARNAEYKEHPDEEQGTERDDLLAPTASDSDLVESAAISALAHIVPQTDEAALAVMEAVNHKDLRIRRAASRALANALLGSTEESSSEK